VNLYCLGHPLGRRSVSGSPDWRVDALKILAELLLAIEESSSCQMTVRASLRHMMAEVFGASDSST
jgi:hypothetical protein